MPLEGDAVDAPEDCRQWALTALGALLTGTAAVHFLQHGEYPDPMVVAATVGPAVGVFLYGLWFWRAGRAAPRGDAVFVWAVGGAGLVLALDLWAVYADAYGDVAMQHVFVQHTSVGALGGAVAGTYAERDRWRARSRMRLLRALDSAMDGIAVLDDDGVIQYANDAFAAAHGVDDTSAVVGRSWAASYPAGTRARIAEVLDELDAGDDETWQGTVTAARDDDTTYPQELSMSTVEGGYVWVCRDVTRRQERDQRLRVLNRVLRHDTRNTLNVVLGRTDRLAARVDAAEAGEDVAAIRDAAESLLATSEKARRLEDALARNQTGAEPVDDLVRAEAAAVRDEYPEASITVSVSADTPVDERLRLPLHELLVNAVEHSTTEEAAAAETEQGETEDGEQGAGAAGAEVAGAEPTATAGSSVGHRRRDDDGVGSGGDGSGRSGSAASGAAGGARSPTVEVSVVDDPLAVRVSDDGPGIPEHERRALSGVEETPLQHGSGVGLWLVYWVVTQTGGDVAVADGDVVVRPAGKN